MNGANFLRDCVRWLDNRAEFVNDGKSPLKLIKEFQKETGITVNDYDS